MRSACGFCLVLALGACGPDPDAVGRPMTLGGPGTR